MTNSAIAGCTGSDKLLLEYDLCLNILILLLVGSRYMQFLKNRNALPISHGLRARV